MKFIRDEYTRQTKIIKGALLIGIVIFAGQYMAAPDDEGALYSSRNFYGVVHIYELYDTRSLHHGTTMHGTQFLDEERAGIPTSYYSPTSGVGRAIINAQAKSGKQPVSVGVIGLGTGTIAAYCDAEDRFVFYEIDKRIGFLANSFFSYLSNCPKAEVHYGDGRLSLANELAEGEKGAFDVLAIDAFSDDTIPVHLLTKEAVALYLQHMRSDRSLIAVHTSNRFFELAPVVMKIAVELGLSSMIINDLGEETEGASSSQWILLSKDASVLQQEVFSSAASEPWGLAPLWTDDYANVFSALDLNALKFWGRE